MVTTLLLLGLTLLLPVGTPSSAPPAKDGTNTTESVLAVVNGTTITEQMFSDAVRLTARERFYHSVNPEKIKDLLHEVANNLVDKELLLQEAKRRGVGADETAVAAQIAQYEKQYASSAQWQQMRDRVLPNLTLKLRHESTLEKLEATHAAQVPAPDKSSVRRYYETHPDKFTTPEKVELSIIMLQVDPSSPSSAWQAAEEEALKLIEKLQSGGNFAELASLHSAHKTADDGGRMGFIHKGMLAENAQKATDPLKPGGLTQPLRLLEGIAIFRLESRIEAKLNPLEKVEERAAALTHREQKEQAWQALKDQLRAASPVKIDETILQRFSERLISTPATASPGGHGSP